MKLLPTLLITTFVLHTAANAQQFLLLTGTYTQTGSKGICVHQWDAATGRATAKDALATSNPSFLALAPDGKMLFAVNENQPGTISCFRFNKSDGSGRLLNQVASGGNNPCYIAVHPSGKWLVAGNYSSGTLISYRIRKSGLTTPPLQTLQHQGSSVNPTRQNNAHVHATVFAANGKELYVTDLGTDLLHIYQTTKRRGIVKEKQRLQLPAGSGPRHLAIHPNNNVLYVLNELTATVAVVQRNNQRWELQHLHPILPTLPESEPGAADIHLSPDGRFLYCSNRGNTNSISVFSVSDNGSLHFLETKSSGGMKPRNFTIDPTGNYLLVANQDSDSIAVFRRSTETGSISDTGIRIGIPQPVCLIWVQ